MCASENIGCGDFNRRKKSFLLLSCDYILHENFPPLSLENENRQHLKLEDLHINFRLRNVPWLLTLDFYDEVTLTQKVTFLVLKNMLLLSWLQCKILYGFIASIAVFCLLAYPITHQSVMKDVLSS